MMSLSTTTNTTTPKPTLLTLPAELLNQILILLLTPSATSPPLTIRSLFIRAHFRNVFMTQPAHAHNFSTSVLRVCRALTHLALPILYAHPLWRAECRLDALATQIGRVNFGFIRRLVLDVDDLGSVVESVGLPLGQGLSFANVRHLEVPGYQAIALTAQGSRASQREAVRLCAFAQRILRSYPVLRVLVQRDPRMGDDGGADAVDGGLGRVRWRFAGDAGGLEESEFVVDLEETAELLKWLLEADPEEDGTGVAMKRTRTKDASSLAVDWTETGFYSQYPYLQSAGRV